jgi:Carbohydrate family 9 binding domain-like/Domain of unknown function (DUF5916)
LRPAVSATLKVGRAHAFASLLLLASTGTGHALAQEVSVDGGDSKVAYIVRTTEPPVIDGRLDDEAWALAPMIDDFHQVTPVEYAEPTQKTQVFLLYDSDALYVGVRLFDTEPEKINALVLRQGEGLGADDRFWVLIDTFNNRRSGYVFGMNANGVRFDGLFQNVTERQFDWDGIWQGAANIDDKGWTIEYAIPFKTLSFDPANDTWRMNFQRTVARYNENSAWASRNRRTDPSIMGRVKGFENLDQGLGLDVAPGLSLGKSKDFSASGKQSDTKPSLDVFYKVTPSLNASLTLNTDFSATEIDTRQVNLTRFDLFYPEKRGFFLQDLDLFQFGRIGGSGIGFSELTNTATTRPSRENGRPFFSRRLGLDADGNQVDLNYGAKLSGRIGQRWELGALAVQQDQVGSFDRTDALVARLAANVLGESSVGIIATSGDPRSNTDNSLIGADFRYLNSRLPGGRSIESEAWYQETQTDGLEGDNHAMGVGFRMPNTTGLRGGLSVKELEQNFKPALGYVNSTGIRDQTMEFGYLYRPKSTWLRSITTGVDVDRIDYLDGGVQSRIISLRALELDGHERDQFNLRFIRDEEGLRDPFEISDGVIIPPGVYEFDQYYLEGVAGPQRRVSGNFVYQGGDFYDGEQLSLKGAIRWRPSKHLRTNFEYEYNDVSLPQGDFTVRLIRMQFDAVFSNTLSWVNLIQYDNVSETLGFNSRLDWIPEAGHEAFLIFNHNLADPNHDHHFVSTYSDVTVKLAYTWRF